MFTDCSCRLVKVVTCSWAAKRLCATGSPGLIGCVDGLASGRTGERRASRKWIVRRLPALLVPALVLIALPAGVVARVLIVTKRHVGYPHYRSIQRAVNVARPGDWILIDRGVYYGKVRIRTTSLHLRGLNRNKVILDGRHQAGNGIEILSNDVRVENRLSSRFGGDSSVREGDLDAGAAEVDHRDQRVGGVEAVGAV